MIRSFAASLAALTLTAGLAAPALADAEEDAGSQTIRVMGVRGYSVLDHEHVVLDGIGDRHYLVTLRRPCPSLIGGMRIGTSFAATGRVYNPRWEYLTTGGVGGERCYIETLEEVADRETARSLIEERRLAEEAEAETVGE